MSENLEPNFTSKVNLTGKGSKKTQADSKSTKTRKHEKAYLNFTVDNEFKKEFRQLAVDKGMKLNELLKELVSFYKDAQKHK